MEQGVSSQRPVATSDTVIVIEGMLHPKKGYSTNVLVYVWIT